MNQFENPVFLWLSAENTNILNFCIWRVFLLLIDDHHVSTNRLIHSSFTQGLRNESKARTMTSLCLKITPPASHYRCSPFSWPTNPKSESSDVVGIQPCHHVMHRAFGFPKRKSITYLHRYICVFNGSYCSGRCAVYIRKYTVLLCEWGSFCVREASSCSLRSRYSPSTASGTVVTIRESNLKLDHKRPLWPRFLIDALFITDVWPTCMEAVQISILWVNYT